MMENHATTLIEEQEEVGYSRPTESLLRRPNHEHGSRVLCEKYSFTCADVIATKPTYQKLSLYLGIVLGSIFIHTVASVVSTSITSLVVSRRICFKNITAAATFGSALSIFLSLPSFICAAVGLKWRRLYGETCRVVAFAGAIAIASFIVFRTVPWPLEVAAILFAYPLNITMILERPVAMGSRILIGSSNYSNERHQREIHIDLSLPEWFYGLLYQGVNSWLFVLFVRWLGFELCPPLAAPIASCLYTLLYWPYRYSVSQLLSRTWEVGACKEIPIHLCRHGNPPPNVDLDHIYDDAIRDTEQYLATKHTAGGYGTFAGPSVTTSQIIGESA